MKVLVLALALLAGCAVLETKGAVVGCQAADSATTLHAVSLGAQEANPVVRWLLDTLGPGGFIAAKVSVTLLLLHHYPELSSNLVVFVNGVTCAVAAHNLRVASQLSE